MLEEELKGCQAVLFDFDGVLCNDRFYDLAMRPEHDPLCDWIQEKVFRDSKNREMLQRWMRGSISYRDVNKMIAEKNGVEAKWLDEMLAESVRRMCLDESLVELALELKKSGKKIGIVTDNMDVFSLITVPEKRLSSVFEVISNSADCGLLKKDKGGDIFDRVISGLGVKIAETLLIDDNVETIELFRCKGGQGIVWEQK